MFILEGDEVDTTICPNYVTTPVEHDEDDRKTDGRWPETIAQFI